MGINHLLQFKTVSLSPPNPKAFFWQNNNHKKRVHLFYVHWDKAWTHSVKICLLAKSQQQIF
jgi:hypothetical protein